MPLPWQQPINHGTSGGYRVHLVRGQQPCEACSTAHKASLVAWRSVLIVCKECGQEKRRGTGGRCGGCYSRFKRAKRKKKAVVKK